MKIVDLSRSPEKPFAVYERMATTIAELIRRNGGCLPQDLNAEGFSPAEVAEHWRMARALAEVELTAMDPEEDEEQHNAEAR